MTVTGSTEKDISAYEGKTEEAEINLLKHTAPHLLRSLLSSRTPLFPVPPDSTEATVFELPLFFLLNFLLFICRTIHMDAGISLYHVTRLAGPKLKWPIFSLTSNESSMSAPVTR